MKSHSFWIFLLGLIGFTSVAGAQGYQLSQYEPTAAGEWRFAVPAPWYSEGFTPAVGVTLDYGRNPLLGGTVTREEGFDGRPVIGTQLLGRLDLAASFLGRFQVSGSVPLTLLERGTPGFGVAPLGSSALSDPRVGLMVRLFGDAEADAVSLHAGGSFWLPIGAQGDHAGDTGLRSHLRLLLAGIAQDSIRWAFDAGMLLRPEADLTSVRVGPGTTGNALKLAAAVGYTDSARRYHVGPELTYSTLTSRSRAFETDTSALELLVGGQYRFFQNLQAGLAMGTGLIRSIGTPDFRTVARLAYAPTPHVAAHSPERWTHAEPDPTPAPAPMAEAVAEAPSAAPASEEPPTAVAETAAPTAPSDEAPVVASLTPEPPPATPRAQPPLELPRVYFRFNTDEPTPASRAAISEIAAALRRAGTTRVSIEGHCDAGGPEAFNQELSRRRAEFLRRALVAEGIEPGRLTVRGFGSSQPPADGGPASQHRRVELRVLDAP